MRFWCLLPRAQWEMRVCIYLMSVEFYYVSSFQYRKKNYGPRLRMKCYSHFPDNLSPQKEGQNFLVLCVFESQAPSHYRYWLTHKQIFKLYSTYFWLCFLFHFCILESFHSYRFNIKHHLYLSLYFSAGEFYFVCCWFIHLRQPYSYKL